MPTREELEAEQSPLDQFAVIDERLIAYLQERFSLQVPSPDSTERSDLYHAGSFAVIMHMIDAREYQLEQARERSGTPTFRTDDASEEEDAAEE